MTYKKMSAIGVNKDCVLSASLVLSIVSLVLLLLMTWHFQSSLNLLYQQVEYDKELLLQLQDQQQVVLHTQFIVLLQSLLLVFKSMAAFINWDKP